jgi:acyl-CoA thioesterase-1
MMKAMRRTPLLALFPLVAVLAAGPIACGQLNDRGARADLAPAAPAAAVPAGLRRVPAPAPPAALPATSPAAGASARPLVVFLGDSLTAGLGLDEGQAYPALLGARLARVGEPVRVLNAGVSGDTTAGGLRRLPWLLAQHPAVIVVGLGANDGLRGTPTEEIEANLRQIVRGAQAAGARVLLLGMKIPPNYGPDYAGRFAAIYPRLARELGAALVPFLLEGVGGDPALNQADGIHPTAQGDERVADTVLPYLRRVVESVPAKAR